MLKLYYPVKPFIINQRWGENEACVKDFGTPSQKVVTKKNGVCPVGYEELYPKFGMVGHNGLDLRAGVQPIYASHAGTVVEKQTVPARGLGLGILSHEQYDFGTYGIHFAKTRYWHLKSFTKDVGDTVNIGDIIGTSDNTGASSGNHLHWELQLWDKDAGGHPIRYNHPDMIAGTIDPTPYLINVYAKDVHEPISYYEKALQLISAILAELQKPR